MITLDLFEQDPNFRKPVEYENRKQYGTVNLANFIKAYQSNQPVQFDFPGGLSYKLSAQWVDMLGDYYNTLETQNDKAQLVYYILTDYNKTIRLLNSLAQTKLFEKKSSATDDSQDFKSTKLSRLKTQARAKYPAAGSDIEALAADFVDSQESDQKEFARVKATNKKQDELLKQLAAINRAQDQEIDGLEGDEAELIKNINQIRAANAELAKKLSAMGQRKKSKDDAKTTEVPQSADDTIVIAPQVDQPEEKPTPAPKPTAKRKRRSKAEIDAEKASQAAMAAMTKMAGGAKINPVEPDIPPAPTVGEPATIPPEIPKTINLFPGVTDTETPVTPQPPTSDVEKTNNVLDFPGKLEKVANTEVDTQPQLKFKEATESTSIPLKSVVQGYTVIYDPQTKRATVSRGGQIIGTGINRLGSPKYHLTLINKIIDRAEDDKYPTDIDVRDVALPGPKMAEGSVFGQQKFDTQMGLAKLKSQLEKSKTAQSAPLVSHPQAQPQPVPARLSDLQARQQKFANLASIKKDIEALQSQATRGGRMLPRGLAADLEDYFSTADVDSAYDDMMAKYQKQLSALQQYLGMRKVLWSPKKDVHEMKISELNESGMETWTVHFTDGTAVRVRVSDETDPAMVRKHYANKGKTVAKFDYGFGVDQETGPGPEAHEPGSGRAVSARTGETLPESEVSVTGQPVKHEEGYYSIYVKRGDRWSPLTKYPDRAEAEEIKRGLEKRGEEVIIREGRTGYNPLTSEKHWHEVERQLSNLINDRTLDPESRAEARQRYLEKRREAQQKGWAK